MTAYNDLIDSYGNEGVDFNEIDQKEANDLLAAFLMHEYKKKYNSKIIDFLSLSSDKIAAFLAAKEKNNDEKAKVYDEFHDHLVETLSEHFGDDINDDIDQSYNEFHSKENYEANAADSKLKQAKERGYLSKIFDKAYYRYNKARLEYFNIITAKELEKKELCRKA